MLKDFIDFNPRETLPKGQPAKKVAMEKLRPFCRDIEEFEVAKYSGGTKFRNGDTLLARITPCLENGKTAQVRFLNDGEVGFGSTEYIVLRAKEGVSDSDYIYYLSTSPKFREIAIQSMVGSSGRQRVQQDVLEKAELHIPPLDEQRKIAGVLSALDDKIELNNKINRNLEAQAQAIFKSWFIDFEPFKNGKFIDSELGRIPEGWKVESIYSISEVIYGAPFSSNLFNNKQLGTPIIRIRDLPNEASNTYTTESHPKGYLIKQGDIVVGMDGEFKAYLWGGDNAWLNQRICVFKSKLNVSTAFVMFSIVPLLNEVESSELATTVIHLGKNDIDRFKIILPKLNILKEFNRISIPIFDTIIKNKKESQRLVQLRESLLPKLISGEVNISDYIG